MSNGVSFGEACNAGKETIKFALYGMTATGETDERGLQQYSHASSLDCEKTALAAYDEVVYQAEQALAAARALEEYIKIVTAEPLNVRLFSQLMNKEREKESGYRYENDFEAGG